MSTLAPEVRITYCTRCRWLLRAQWYAAELLSTFEHELAAVSLVPGSAERDAGVFRVEVDDTLVWDRKREDGFPEVAELKRRVRDLVAPDSPLGHADR